VPGLPILSIRTDWATERHHPRLNRFGTGLEPAARSEGSAIPRRGSGAEHLSAVATSGTIHLMHQQYFPEPHQLSC
jgi:hypothetical protein